MVDCIIVGSGPAGLSAALNLKKYGKDFLWFGSKRMSEKVTKAERITNYPGIPDVTGEELFEKFSAHMKHEQIGITEKTATLIDRVGGKYMVLADNEIFESRTVILCTGVLSQKTLTGEDEFLGRGVSYCATCDGMFYKGKIIAVVSNDPKYEHEVKYLAGLASKVYFFPSYKNPEVNAENVTVMGELPVEVQGEKKVNGLVLRNGEKIPLDGVFCLRNAIAPSKLVPALAVENGHISVDRGCRTNLEGCFAAGDCTGRPYQYTKAVGEGNVAAHSCIEYLASLSKENSIQK